MRSSRESTSIVLKIINKLKMVGWIVNRSRIVAKRYLNEDTFRLVNHGYFSIHKRQGKTCAEELEDIKQALVEGIKDEVIEDEQFLLRAGHGGILDSMATGVLVVALCNGCKVLPVMLKSSKRYSVTAQLGLATDSYNSSGNVVAEASYDHVTRPMLEKALTEFVGDIWQRPPVYSALKVSGRRAADIARAGGEVNMIPRPVKCHALHCLEFEPPFVKLDVSCGHGFYVRTLVHDLTQAFGTCGHVTALERTKHGPFTSKDCLHPEEYNLDNIVKAVREARRKHPKLAQYIENYWTTHKRDARGEEREKSMGRLRKDSDEVIRDSRFNVDRTSLKGRVRQRRH